MPSGPLQRRWLHPHSRREVIPSARTTAVARITLPEAAQSRLPSRSKEETFQEEEGRPEAIFAGAAADGYSAVAGSRNGVVSEVVDSSPAASRVSVSTVISSSCPKATAASEACWADGRDANSVCKRSNP